MGADSLLPDSSSPLPAAAEAGGLRRHFGLVQATALNVTQIVGAGVFVTIPLMLRAVPGPYAVLGWVAAGALMLVDGMIWSELGATLPGSGGSYLYLLESYGRQRWGRLMAFLFIWQFLISGPLEVASGLIAIGQFSTSLSRHYEDFNQAWTWKWSLVDDPKTSVFGDLSVAVGPAQLLGLLIGVGILFLLYRRITVLGRLAVTFWVGVLGVIAWILIEGGLHFDRAIAFDFSDPQTRQFPSGFQLGALMILAMYSYLGYYTVCYIGDEVRDPGRTIPRSILLSAFLVGLLFIGVHWAMLGTVPAAEAQAESMTNLPAEFMRRLHGDGAAVLVTLLLIWSCGGSAFAALLGYSRIPYGAARYGHFFAVLGRVHPVHQIPHVALLLVGGLTLFWSFFSLDSVITALITTRILEQFVGQIVGVVLLRRREPDRPRPYKMWLYPLPCGLALIGWLYMYISASLAFIVLGIATLALGVVAFLIWSYRTGEWPFGARIPSLSDRA